MELKAGISFADQTGTLTDAGGVLKHSCNVHDRIKGFSAEGKKLKIHCWNFRQSAERKLRLLHIRRRNGFIMVQNGENSRENELYGDRGQRKVH